jgi:hypothetical protein
METLLPRAARLSHHDKHQEDIQNAFCEQAQCRQQHHQKDGMFAMLTSFAAVPLFM